MEIDEKILLPVKFDYNLVEKYLKNKGISRTNFAKMIDITPAYITQILGAAKVPAIDIGIRIARFTGISLDLLYKNKTNDDIDTILLPREITDNINFQPSEFAKVFVVIFFAYIITKIQKKNV